MEGAFDGYTADSTRTIGEMHHGVLEGAASLSYSDGNSARGSFRLGKPDGTWTVTDRDGRSVTVEFEDGEVESGSAPMTISNPVTPNIEGSGLKA